MASGSIRKNIFSIVLVLVIAVLFYLNFNNLVKKSASNKPQNIFLNEEKEIILYGSNNEGQLGSPPYLQKNKVNSLSFDGEIVEIAAGKNHTLALNDEGRVESWGGNESGQLGYRTEGKTSNHFPQKIDVIAGAVKISSKDNHSLLLLNNGKVYSFGSNLSGQLGTGGNENSIYPVEVQGLPRIKNVSAGYKFSLALSEDGQVWGWGASCGDKNKREAEEWWKNVIGSLDSIEGGYYDVSSDSFANYDKNEYCVNEQVVGILSKVPIKINGLSDISKMSAGYGHALLLNESGEVYSFGCNTYKQLGRMTETKDDNKPKKVEGVVEITDISAGYRHSIALKKDGTLWGWGLNSHGELGRDTETEFQTIPVEIPINDVVKAVAGYDYTIALKKDGTLWGWGVNTDNWIKESFEEYVETPTQIQGLSNIKDIAAGRAHIAAISK